MIGIFSKTIDSNLVEAIGQSGLDFMIFDQEHGTVDTSTIQNHVRASKVSNMMSVIRVCSNEPYYISKALDSGVDAVQIPNISNVEEAKKAIKAANFYPNGMRGVCCYVKSADFGFKEKTSYFSDANKKQIILQVEGKEGMDSIDEILKLDGFDILFIGPYDLSQALGFPGQVDHPKVVEAINLLANKVKESGKTLGTFADSMEKVVSYKKQGFGYIAYSVDLYLFSKYCSEIKNI